MFLAHFAVGLAAKKAAPKTSLGTSFLAAQLIDLLWPIFVFLGIENARIDPSAPMPIIFEHYPYSHSLFAVLIWAVLFAIIYQWRRHYMRGATVLALAVISHWLLDALVHEPDLPIYPGSTLFVGMRLWSYPMLAFLSELFIFAVGVWIYAKTTNHTDQVGKWGFIGLIGALVLIYFANTFGSAPPSVFAVAVVGQAQWLLVAWGYWVDRHRQVLSNASKFE